MEHLILTNHQFLREGFLLSLSVQRCPLNCMLCQYQNAHVLCMNMYILHKILSIVLIISSDCHSYKIPTHILHRKPNSHFSTYLTTPDPNLTASLPLSHTLVQLTHQLYSADQKLRNNYHGSSRVSIVFIVIKCCVFV